MRTSLYAIADAASLGSDPAIFARSVRAMVDGGVRRIQLRLKPRPDLADDWRYRLVERTLEGLADGPGDVELWIDDRADLAACFSDRFAGVHVGQRDLPPSAVRSVLRNDVGGRRVDIGLSCHCLDEVRAADGDPDVDWVAIGPVYSTSSKPDPDPVVGLSGVVAARAATSKPLVAIGGLDAHRIPGVLAAGADCAVVLGALVAGGRRPREIEASARRLVEAAVSGSSSCLASGPASRVD